MAALNADHFRQLMQSCGPYPALPRLAVAVSGGPDSMALAHLLHTWVRLQDGSLHAFTVDHGLRPESRSEAENVGRWCATQKIPHTILSWEKNAIPQSAVHEEARKARQTLLYEACRQHHIEKLFFAHHADDQAETVLMRFAKGSGPDGLASMAAQRHYYDVTFQRPLLPVRKTILEQYCAENNIPYARDASNRATRFARGRLREAQAILQQEGLTTERLYEVARHAGLARAALEQMVNDWLSVHATCSSFGVVSFARHAWQQLNPDMKRRCLLRALLCVSGAEHSPRSDSLDMLVQKLEENSHGTQTLGGCLIQYTPEHIALWREENAATEILPLQAERWWDNRFHLVSDESLLGKNISVQKLGNLSRDTLEKNGAGEIAALPALTRSVLPALFKNNTLFMVPSFDSTAPNQHGKQVLVKASFFPKRPFIISPFHVAPPLLSC